MLTMDLRKMNEELLIKFKNDIPKYILENVDGNSLYVEGIKGADFLEPISMSTVIDFVIKSVDSLFPLILRNTDGREILGVEIEKRNYNYNFVKSVTQIKIGTYQVGFGTATIYNTIELCDFDKKAQDENFEKAISNFSEEEMDYYKEIYAEQTPVFRSFDCVNSMILDSLYDGFVYEYEVNNDFNELNENIREYIKNSEYSKINNIIHIDKINKGASISLNKYQLSLTA